MAKYTSIIDITGTVSNLTFSKTIDGTIIKNKSRLSKSKIKNSPQFVRTRENMSEFGRAAQSGKLIREAFNLLANKYVDIRLSSRMVKALIPVAKLDTTSARGSRLVAIGIATPQGKAALNNFEFNTKAQLSTVLKQPYVLDPVTGNVSIAQLDPVNGIVFPKGADTATFKAAWAKIDFSTGTYNTAFATPASVTATGKPADLILKPTTVPSGSTTAINFNVLAIQFLQTTNGVLYSLNDGAYDALTIIGVE